MQQNPYNRNSVVDVLTELIDNSVADSYEGQGYFNGYITVSLTYRHKYIIEVYMNDGGVKEVTLCNLKRPCADYENLSMLLEKRMMEWSDFPPMEDECDEYDYNGFQDCVDYYKFKL